jgi:uncharacterized RDD family membrane protein YckC
MMPEVLRMSDSGKDDLTPLERYLAKQKQIKAAKHEMPKPSSRGWLKSNSEADAGLSSAPPKATSGTTGTTAPASSGSEERALEAGAPALPHSVLKSEPNQKLKDQPTPEAEGLIPGDMFARTVAYFIDWAIVWALAWPVQAVLIGIFNVFSSATLDFTVHALRLLSFYVIVYGYYGWFYTRKGASPGKLLMGLQIVDSTDGSRLTYWKAFFREAVGKWISLVPLGIGYLTAFFRDDRRALHDLLFDTAVVKGPSARNKT